MRNEGEESPKLLGILGGMGPAATIDFMDKLVKVTAAKKDQDQIPALVYNNTQIPDRNEAFLRGGESPLPELIKSAKILEKSGCDIMAIPCNTAHIWFDEIANSTTMEVLNAPGIVSKKLSRGSRAGIICTTPVKLSGLYRDSLLERDVELFYPESQDAVMEAIYMVKSGKMHKAEQIFMEQVDSLRREGCERIIAGCSEVSVALGKSDPMQFLVDPMESLAAECARRFKKI
ncbi:amino acid racemase [Oxyplasma meridianum]|uniref:Amino acid racemase n=1 Tax=Oxyplasma meridianum TaxID=3073602 RepID=A0AAX4NGX7_9ARCH